MSKKKQLKNQEETKTCKFPPNSEELKILDNDPAYFCRDCGKTSASADNLCQSEPMFNAW